MPEERFVCTGLLMIRGGTVGVGDSDVLVVGSAVCTLDFARLPLVQN